MGGRRSTLVSSLAWAIAIISLADAAAQQPRSHVPYAAIDHSRIVYAGPDRADSRDLKGPEVKIGLIAPLGGSRQSEGEALVLAARLAIEDLTRRQSGGPRLELAIGDESGPWGRASSEVVRLVTDRDSIAVVTSAGGSTAHLAEQIGNKLSVPILTLATDSTTTEINMPWIFRLSPDDRAQAEAFARMIYRERGYQRVLLISERDHDGRLGGTTFERAVFKLGAPPPEHVEVDAQDPDFAGTMAAIQSHLQAEAPASAVDHKSKAAQAVVIWTGDSLASRLVSVVRQAVASLPVFLCEKAVPAATGMTEGVWTLIRSGADESSRRSFIERFRSRAGIPPGPEAVAAYDAILLVGTALAHSGPNRARLRDELAKVSGFAGISGQVSFDGAGNNVAAIQVVAAR